MPSSPETVIWVERLTAPAALRLGILRGAAIRYDENRATPAGLAAARLFGARFTPARLRLNVHLENGEGLVYRRCEHLTAAVTAFAAKAWPDAPPRERRMVECFLATELLARAGFLTMAQWAAREFPDARHEAYVAGHFLNGALIEHFAAAGFPVTQSCPGPEGLRFFLVPFALIAKSLLASPASTPRAPRPAIWIEQAPRGAVWDQFQTLAGRFASSAKRGYDVVYYLDRFDTPDDEATRARLAAMSLGLVPLFDVAAAARLPAGELLGAAWTAWRSSSGRPCWLRFLLLQSSLLRVLHAAVFRLNGVKVLIQHQETSWKQEPKARALEDAGGIMAGVHWSNYEHYDFPTHLTPQHVFFVWGASHREILEKRGHSCEHIVPCGVWMPADAGPPGAPVFAPGVTVKLAAFDSDAYYDLYMSPESLFRFYDWLAGLLERRAELGLLLKPKAIGPGRTGLEALSALPGGAALAARFESLRAAGRLVVLDGNVNTPLDAARWADVAVAFGLNTAGFLAALRGVPTLQWDCAGWKRHPAQAAAGRAVFADLADLDAALERRLAGDKTVGDLGALRREINHFDDFAGFGRAFGVLDAFMTRVAAGETRAAALAAAVENYYN